MNAIASRFSSAAGGSSSSNNPLGALEDYEGYDPESMRGSTSTAPAMPRFDLPSTDVS